MKIMKIQALLDCFDDKSLTEIFDEENFIRNFMLRFLGFVMPGILTFSTLIIYSTIQGLSEEVFYDFRVFIPIVTMISAEILILVMLIYNLKPENPGETLSIFKKMFVPITELALIILISIGYQSLTFDIIARDAERRTPVVKLTLFTYFAYFLVTLMVLSAYYRRNKQSTSNLESENCIKSQDICTVESNRLLM
ncbi:uncharacterized protein LOC103574741 [Microplitis demolitor]|uniref:uncharacterized protein LOC103574741 n=1 Tax=Microplitis demolitor TaxID=69319 RepID=UPI0004CD9775|nr:uncharacterized protein LOC103574741 [Microplitis demolitor]